MTKQEISKTLADNLEFYVNDPSKRCIEGGKCMYSGKTLGLDTPGCFVGKLLPLEIREYLDSGNDVIAWSLNTFNKVESKFSNLPKIFTKDNVLLITYFQQLHDTNSHWDKEGLSLKGKLFLNRILGNFKDVLIKSDFKKFLK